jgi:hypothetical protein
MEDGLWKEKLLAFLEGLQVHNISKLVEAGNVDDYRKLGEAMVSRIKAITGKGK